MLSTNSVVLINEACTRFSIPLPKAVVAADALHSAAVDLLTDIRAETAPDLETLTIRNIKDTHTAMVLRTTFQTRERAAVEIEGLTATKSVYAWHLACTALLEAFRTPFDKAAGTFVTALKTLDGNVDPKLAIDAGLHSEYRALTTSAADLSVLAIVRDAIATSVPFDSGHPDLDKIGRITTIPDARTLGRRLPGTATYRLDWFVELAGVPGVVIKWHTPSEQQTYRALPSDLIGSTAHSAPTAA